MLAAGVRQGGRASLFPERAPESDAHIGSKSLARVSPSAVASLWRDPFPFCGRAVARRAEEVLAPLSGRIFVWQAPRVETPTPLGLRRGQVIRLYQTLDS
jgi:hypothetical protein